VTFGFLNNPAKLNDTVNCQCCGDFARVSKSRLRSSSRGSTTPACARDSPTPSRANGIGTERIDISGGAPHTQFLVHIIGRHRSRTPSPYSGGLTTCEALWMGCPVVTFSGRDLGRTSCRELP